MTAALQTKPLAQAAPFRLEKVTGTLGAEVSGLDLAGPLQGDAVAALSDALVEHKVLFFRDQPITLDQHVAFGRRFGPLEVHPFAELTARSFVNDSAHPEIIVVESTPDKPQAADQWHSDVSFRQEPALGSILRCRIAPPAGGDTLWADMAAAYDALDDATRSHISGLTAIHDWEIFRKGLRKHLDEAQIEALNARFPPAEHPVVRTHPVSGRKILYVNANFTVGIKGMKAGESQALLERLYRQAAIPDVQVRLRWRPDTIAFWDNRSTQHYATKDFFPQHRRMERVTVAGDRPF